MKITNKIEYRKMQAMVGDLSFSLVLPKQWVVDLGIGKGDFAKVHRDDGSIIIEKA